jgi:hypothetical protein
MALESWVDDFDAVFMLIDGVGDGDGIALGFLKADLKSLHRTVSKPRVEGRHTSSHGLHDEEDPVV